MQRRKRQGGRRAAHVAPRSRPAAGDALFRRRCRQSHHSHDKNAPALSGGSTPGQESPQNGRGDRWEDSPGRKTVRNGRGVYFSDTPRQANRPPKGLGGTSHWRGVHPHLTPRQENARIRRGVVPQLSQRLPRNQRRGPRIGDGIYEKKD